jgi:hypothetical protein
MSQQEEFSGAVIEGSDGELYLIPDAELARFRVSDKRAKQLQAHLDDAAEVSGFSMGSTDQVGGVMFPNIQPLKAVRTDLGSPKTAVQGFFQYQGSPQY